MRRMSFTGTFRQGGSRAAWSNGGTEREPSIVVEGHALAERDDYRLYWWGMLYNPDEFVSGREPDAGATAEAVLTHFLREGREIFRRLDGKFVAIVISPYATWIARDRTGSGMPVYFTHSAFASSVAGVTATGNGTPGLDREALLSVLHRSYIPSPRTPFAGVSKLAAGEVLIADADGARVWNPFDFDAFAGSPILDIGEDEAVGEYERLMRQSIERRIAGKSSIGMLLSGGYDSGGIAGLIRTMRDGSLRSFSVGFRDNPLSEHVYAADMARKCGYRHTEALLDHTAIERMPAIIEYLGEPFAEAGVFINDAAMGMASGECDVVLGGDGNDQMFGTGMRELALYLIARRTGIIGIQRLFDAVSDLPVFENERLAQLRTRNRNILNVSGRMGFGFDDRELRRLATSPWRGDLIMRPPLRGGGFDRLYDERAFYVSIRLDMNEAILRKASRASDAHGVHLAFPYVDRDVYDFVKRLPRPLRLKGSFRDVARGRGRTKYVQRKLVAPMLPPVTAGRKKQGGFTPLPIFFGDAARRAAIYAYIRRSAAARDLVRPAELDAALARCESVLAVEDGWFWRRHQRANQVLNLLAVAIWWDIFIGGDRRERLADYIERATPGTVRRAPREAIHTAGPTI